MKKVSDTDKFGIKDLSDDSDLSGISFTKDFKSEQALQLDEEMHHVSFFSDQQSKMLVNETPDKSMYEYVPHKNTNLDQLADEAAYLQDNSEKKLFQGKSVPEQKATASL